MTEKEKEDEPLRESGSVTYHSYILQSMTQNESVANPSWGKSVETNHEFMEVKN
jgi:hypothetical protein